MNVEGHQHGCVGQGDAPDNAKELPRLEWPYADVPPPKHSDAGGAMAPTREDVIRGSAASISRILSPVGRDALLHFEKSLCARLEALDEAIETGAKHLAINIDERERVRKELTQLSADLS